MDILIIKTALQIEFNRIKRYPNLASKINRYRVLLLILYDSVIDESDQKQFQKEEETDVLV